jgi:hypothetical protein
MGLLYKDDPYEINFDDEHPPMSARAYVCWRTLTDTQQSEKLTRVTETSWAEHLKIYVENSDCRLICSQKLLDRLVKVAVIKIEELLPNSKRYESSLPIDAEVDQFNTTLSFEDILNRSTKILLLFPERYSVWEYSVIQFLGL